MRLRATRPCLRAVLAVAVVCAATAAVAGAQNAIVVENRKPGTTDWLLTRVEPVPANIRDER